MKRVKKIIKAKIKGDISISPKETMNKSFIKFIKRQLSYNETIVII